MWCCDAKETLRPTMLMRFFHHQAFNHHRFFRAGEITRTGYWKDETIDMYVDFQRLFPFTSAVFELEMTCIFSTVTQPQEGWLEVNTKSSRVRAIWMSSATQKQSWTLAIPKGAKQQLMDGGMEQLETSSDWSLNGVSPAFLRVKKWVAHPSPEKCTVSFQSSPFFFCGCLLPHVQRCFQSIKDSAGVRLKIPILRQLLWARPALLANSNSALRTEILKHLTTISEDGLSSKEQTSRSKFWKMTFLNHLRMTFWIHLDFFGCFLLVNRLSTKVGHGKIREARNKTLKPGISVFRVILIHIWYSSYPHLAWNPGNFFQGVFDFFEWKEMKRNMNHESFLFFEWKVCCWRYVFRWFRRKRFHQFSQGTFHFWVEPCWFHALWGARLPTDLWVRRYLPPTPPCGATFFLGNTPWVSWGRWKELENLAMLCTCGIHNITRFTLEYYIESFF